MYKEIFLRICKTYVKQYADHAFAFRFDGEEQRRIGDSSKVIHVNIKDAENVIKQIFKEGSLGFGAAYCGGKIEIDDEDYKHFAFIFVRLAYNRDLLWKLDLLDIMRVMKALYNTRFFTKGTQEADINSHYSLSDWFDENDDSNEFYLRWLNTRYIQYSCGKWDKGTKSLEEAQENKLNFYAKRLGIFKRSEGKTLLDLGCGWGGMIFYMAENFGIRCTGYTLSVAQADHINKEIRRRGLQDLVDVEIRNIHDIRGTYDYIISVGVMEHIADYDDLYKKISKSLNEDGKALIHSMFQTLKKDKIADPFLSKYIFPGAGIPQIQNNLKILKRYFRYVDRNDLPDKSYPKTLQCWFDNFCKNENKIRRLLKEKSKLEDADFAIRVFKHYLTTCYCGLYEDELVSNILVYN